MAEDSLYTGYTKNDEGVGLFIDWENIKIGLNDKYGLTPDIGQLLEAVDRFGQRGVSRAYANWQQHKHLHDDQSKFLMRAVETVQILGRNPHSGRVIKNSADVALAVEAVRLCYTQPDITTFVLVTGDGDLVHLVNELKRNRNRVIIVGVDLSISKVLVEAADEVLVYETDIEPERFAHLLEKRNSARDSRSNNSRTRTTPTRATNSSNTNLTASSSTRSSAAATKTSEATPKKDINLEIASEWIVDILKNTPDGLSASNLGHQLWKKHKFTAKDIDLSLEDITNKLIASEKIQQEDKILKLPPKVSKLDLDTVDKTQHKTWLALEDLMDEQTHLNLKVRERSEDGITVDLASLKLPNYKTKGKNAIKGFIPKSQLDTKRVESVDDITDDELELRILNLEPADKLVTLSRSAVIAANYMKKSKTAPSSSTATDKAGTEGDAPSDAANNLAKLQEGELITAKVTKLMPYGVFVDTGKNVKGLVHISQLSHKQIRHPKQAVSVGDELELKVLSVDADKEHIALSLIAAQDEKADSISGANGAGEVPEVTAESVKTQPVDYTWEEIVEKFPEGTQVEGTISNQTPFGVFVALEPGLSALMHISELGRRNPSAFRRGTNIKAVVANLDHDKQRFSLKPLSAVKAEADKLDAIEQFKLNSEESQEENLSLDSGETSVSAETETATKQAKKTTKTKAKKSETEATLDIGYEATPEDKDYGEVFSTSSGASTSQSSVKAKSSSLSSKNLSDEEVVLYQLVSDLQDENRSILSLNDLYQEYAKANGNQGNLQDFKKLIKKGHENGWLKLLRHSEDKGLYIQLNDQNAKEKPVELA